MFLDRAGQNDRFVNPDRTPTPLLVEHHGKATSSCPARTDSPRSMRTRQLWRYGESEGPFNSEIIVSPVYSDSLVFLQLWPEPNPRDSAARREEPPEAV